MPGYEQMLEMNPVIGRYLEQFKSGPPKLKVANKDYFEVPKNTKKKVEKTTRLYACARGLLTSVIVLTNELKEIADPGYKLDAALLFMQHLAHIAFPLGAIHYCLTHTISLDPLYAPKPGPTVDMWEGDWQDYWHHYEDMNRFSLRDEAPMTGIKTRLPLSKVWTGTVRDHWKGSSVNKALRAITARAGVCEHFSHVMATLAAKMEPPYNAIVIHLAEHDVVRTKVNGHCTFYDPLNVHLSFGAKRHQSLSHLFGHSLASMRKHYRALAPSYVHRPTSTLSGDDCVDPPGEGQDEGMERPKM